MPDALGEEGLAVAWLLAYDAVQLALAFEVNRIYQAAGSSPVTLVSADRDLNEQLSLRVAALGGAPAGALAFSCNGRGREMFGVADHDADALAAQLGGALAAGFFAAGEIGPVGGASFMHSFTR